MGRSNCLVAYLPAILGTGAIVCGTAANLYCETLEFPQNNEGTGATLFVGLWSYRTRDYIPQQLGDDQWAVSVCQSYNYLDRDLGFDYDLDAKARTAMAFSILAPVLGGLTLFYAYVKACSGGRGGWKRGWKSIGIAFLVTALLQGLTLLSLASSICRDNPTLQFLEVVLPNLRHTFPETCQWGPGIRLGITSVVLWGLAGLSPYLVPSPEISRRAPTQSQTVTYQRHADGTVHEARVVVVQGAQVTEQAVVASAEYDKGNF